MTAPNSPWANYPPDYAPEDDVYNEQDTYQPAPLVAAAIMAFCGVMTMLALWKLADIAGAVYSWSIS